MEIKEVLSTHQVKKLEWIIDTRESDSYQLVKELNDIGCPASVAQLEIGDYQLRDDAGRTHCIIEHKTMNDLFASIRDGRYKQQLYRLQESQLPVHYWIDGQLGEEVKKRAPNCEKAVCSAMIHLSQQRASVLTLTLPKADVLSRFHKYYSEELVDGKSMEKQQLKHLCKKRSVSGVVGVLTSIKGVSIDKANCISERWPTVKSIIEQLETDPEEIAQHTVKKRKLGRSFTQNLRESLCK